MEFWTYENWRARGHRATVHLGSCGSCNHGSGIQGGGETPNGKWHGPFESFDAALAAISQGSVDIRKCGKCGPR